MTNPNLTLENRWQTPLNLARCPACGWSYLAAAQSTPQTCPRCFKPGLQIEPPAEDGAQQTAYAAPPELAAPFDLSQAGLEAAVQRFAAGIPYPPKDLNPHNLSRRLQRVYLPQWLVDVSVTAKWKAEAGFNYNVVSHQDRYQDGGGWASREVQEQRIRWEPRLGRLERSYANLPAPALEEQARLSAALGAYDYTKAVPYRPDLLREALVRLPERPPADARADIQPRLQEAAAAECRQAAGADHWRLFSWQYRTNTENWTLLLLPLFTSAYLDDDGQYQVVWINGQSGQITGRRRASLQRAGAASLNLLLIAGVILVLGLLAGGAALFFPPILALAVALIAVALVAGLGAIVPVFRAWSFNRG
ncbi:MAG: hypothetical protein ACKOC5_16950 [Chloroflexota bacterium]